MFAGNLGELKEVVFIIKKLCSDDKFAKLVYFNDDDPLSMELPIGKSNYDLIMYDKVFPYLRNIDISEEGATVYVNIYFGKSVNEAGTSDYKKNYLFIDVFVHQNLWKIDSGIRTYDIMERIDTLINTSEIEKVTEEFHFVDFRALPMPNPKYAGFALTYQKTDSGKRGGF